MSAGSGRVSRREFVEAAAFSVAGLGFCRKRPEGRSDPDHDRLSAWTGVLRKEGLARADRPCGAAVVRVGQLASGTPYRPGTLDAYLTAGGSGRTDEPLTVSLTEFDCVTLVESCIAVSRTALVPTGDWATFQGAIEAMRYRDGHRAGYGSRLHYFSEWVSDGERRGLVRNLGRELGAIQDSRPLGFMTTHRESYPALRDDGIYREIAAMERRLDGQSRQVIPTDRIAGVAGRIETGDVLAFATSIPGLDVTHAALAFRDDGGVMRVLHAPLSGGVVEITRSTLPEYVRAIRHATGILVARPLWGARPA